MIYFIIINPVTSIQVPEKSRLIYFLTIIPLPLGAENNISTK